MVGGAIDLELGQVGHTVYVLSCLSEPAALEFWKF